MGPLLALFAACAPTAPPVELYAVSPDRGWQGETTDVRIEGKNLLPSLNLGAEDEVVGEFEAWLVGADGDFRLEGTELLDHSALTAQVPAGIDPGVYPVKLRTPSGIEASLDDAFRVTLTRADRLTLSIESGVAPVGDYADMTVRVEDPSGVVIPSELSVSIIASSAIGARGVTFGPDQLGGQTAVEGDVGITGALDADGSTVVKVTSSEPDDVRFRVTAVDDDELADGSTLITWEAGAATNAVVSLPFSPYRAVAGQPFTVHIALEDARGNPLPDAYARILLSDECSNYHPKVEVFGAADVEVTLNTACLEDRLTVASDSVGEAVSEPFEVAAAEHTAYRVTATPDSAITAGVDPVLVQVEAVDAYGNVVPDGVGVITLEDDLAGLDAPRTSCPGFHAGVSICSTYLRRAGADIVRVVDEASRRGASGTVMVDADVPTSLDLQLSTRNTVAGREITASVAAVDAWGNLVAFEPGGLDPVNFTDDSGSVACEWFGAIGDGHQSFICAFTTAWENDEVSASIARFGVTGAAPDSITIVNADLAVVDVTAPSSVVAGASFPLLLEGYDLYGNPYLEQSDPVVDLEDTTGTLTISSATLGVEGSVTTAAVLTRASAAVRVHASQAGLRLGSSAAINVNAAGMDGFSVVAPPWVATGTDLDATVQAIDPFGNPIATYGGTPTISVTDDACTTASIGGFASGAASVTVPCSAVVLDGLVTVTDGTYSGVSGALDVVDLACATPPTVAFTLDGETQPVVCLAAGNASVAVDATGSTDGGAPIAAWHFVDNEDQRLRTESGTGTLEWSGAGPRRVEGIAIDENGCGAAATTWVWIGEDDGEPTGPIELTASASTIATGGSLSVDVLAYDCTGDVAVDQPVLLRTSLGTVAGTASGTGLELTLDAAGEGTVSWSFPAGYAAIATLYAGSESAGGYGTATVAVTQDSARPHVVSVTPSGFTHAPVEEVVVSFDEDILPASASGVTLYGPSGAVSASVSVDGSTITLTPDSPLDTSTGSFTLTLSSVVRDEAGNRLDGAWSGAAAAYSSTFGDVADTLPTLAGCSLSTDTFRPDGDDGAGVEADSVELTPVSSASPTWWALDVEDTSGNRVRSTRVDGTSVAITWDGTGDDGLVVAGGSYLITLWAIDAQDNRGEACVESVDVAHRLELP